MTSRHHTPLVGQTWCHASNPGLLNTAPPDGNGLSLTSADNLLAMSDNSWSEDWKNLFSDTNSSDWPGQSAASTVSWSDELENDSTNRLSDQYKEIELALYNDNADSKVHLLNPSLALECQQWRERFPHIRLIGVGITSTSVLPPVEFESTCDEEVIAADGNYQEDVLLEKSVLDNVVEKYSPDNEVANEDIKHLKEKVKKTVLDQIFLKIWPNIIRKIDPVCKKILERNKLANNVPPIICIDSNNSVQSDCDLRFSSNNNYLSVSPTCSRETSSISKSINPIKSHDYLVPQLASSSRRNSTSPMSNSSKTSNSVKLGQSSSVIFPTAEKLLSPILPETRIILQSARLRKKFMQRNNSSSLKTNRNLSLTVDEGKEGRFCSKEDGRIGKQLASKKSIGGYWNRRPRLPPISSKENMKTLSAATQRSISAFQSLGKPDLDIRPSTSLPVRSSITLVPLNEGCKKKSRMELAQEWLEKQISSNNKNNCIGHSSDTASRWRAHHLSHKK